ncbi:MAG: hypothetical protein FD174_2824 [Geobacteraceae bacterium]|nr:MAG: hypothetical protein FD174_2824 [Geobacteraceae bacterium]
MDNLIREITLANGLTLRFYNQTCRYYGDIYRVKLEILCEIPVRAEYFSDQAALAEARAMLGDSVVYRRVVEKMGVPSTEIERVLERLTADFEDHSLPYFAAAAFPRKLVITEITRVKRKRGGSPAGRAGSDA